MNANQINEARSLATNVVHTISATDTSPWMVVQYVPTLGTGGSSAKIALVQNSSMTFTVNGAAPAGADAIGASGVVLTSSSTYDTMGELVDYINGRQAWRAYLVGALRADASSGLLAKTAADAMGANGLTFYGDTSQNESAVVPGTAAAYESESIAISGEKFVNNGKNGHVTDADDECENALHYAAIDLTFTGTGTIRIYEADQTNTETLIHHEVLTSSTLQEYGIQGTAQASGMDDRFISASRGKRLIIRAATTTAFTTWTQFNVVGRTAVLSGDRIVDTINYTAG